MAGIAFNVSRHALDPDQTGWSRTIEDVAIADGCYDRHHDGSGRSAAAVRAWLPVWGVRNRLN
jgi:hypothetical protein